MRLNEWDDEDEDVDFVPLRCKTCGSTDVRWRMQGGNWQLFSLQPGVLHKCNADDLAKDFD